MTKEAERNSIKRALDSLKQKMRTLNESYTEDSEQLRKLTQNEEQISNFIRDLNNQNKQYQKQIELKREQEDEIISQIENHYRDGCEKMMKTLDHKLHKRVEYRRKVEVLGTELATFGMDVQRKTSLYKAKIEELRSALMIEETKLVGTHRKQKQVIDKIIIDGFVPPYLMTPEPEENQQSMYNENEFLSMFKKRFTLKTELENLNKKITTLQNMKDQFSKDIAGLEQ